MGVQIVCIPFFCCLPEIYFCANMSKLFPIFFKQAIVDFLDLNTVKRCITYLGLHATKLIEEDG